MGTQLYSSSQCSVLVVLEPLLEFKLDTASVILSVSVALACLSITSPCESHKGARMTCTMPFKTNHEKECGFMENMNRAETTMFLSQQTMSTCNIIRETTNNSENFKFGCFDKK